MIRSITNAAPLAFKGIYGEETTKNLTRDINEGKTQGKYDDSTLSSLNSFKNELKQRVEKQVPRDDVVCLRVISAKERIDTLEQEANHCKDAGQKEALEKEIEAFKKGEEKDPLAVSISYYSPKADGDIQEEKIKSFWDFGLKEALENKENFFAVLDACIKRSEAAGSKK